MSRDLVKGAPLTRDHLTSASRVMLPTYAFLFLGVGFSYMLTPRARMLQSPVLEFAENYTLHVWVWGSIFLAIGVTLSIALYIQRRDVYRFGLYAGRICTWVWVLIFLGAVVFSDASVSTALWPWFVAQACKATEFSLRNDEVI